MNNPWLIIWILDGQLYKSKHESREKALEWAKAHEAQAHKADDSEYEFDILDTHVFINGPDQEMEELQSDFFII